MTNAYNYSNTAIQTTLSGSISNVALTITVAAVTGFPIAYPYVLAIDFGGAAEELVTVTSAAGTTLTLGARGFGGTSAQSHSLGAVVRHVHNAVDDIDFRTHEAAIGAVHGLTGNIVGTTDTQTLTNKTLTAPIINAATISGTFAGPANFTGANTFTGNPAIKATPSAAANLNMLLQGVASQTGNFLEIRDSAATLLNFISPSGRIEVSPNNVAIAPITANPPTGQTGDLLRLQVNSVNQAKFTKDGKLNITPGANVAATSLLVNEPTGFGSNLFDLQVNAASKFSVTASGFTSMPGGWQAGSSGQVSVAASDGFATFNGAGLNGTATMNNYAGIAGQGLTYKTSNTTRTNTITRTNDPHLNQIVNANFVYALEVWLIFDTSTVADIAFNWSFPTGATMVWDSWGQPIGNTTSSGTIYTGGQDQTVAVAIAGIGVGTKNTAHFRGTVFISSTGGNLILQWAQSTAEATNTTLQVGSWMRLTRLA